MRYICYSGKMETGELPHSMNNEVFFKTIVTPAVPARKNEIRQLPSKQ